MTKLGRYLLNWLIWLDEGANVARGGDAHETISSVAGKAQIKGERWACILCGLLDKIQKDHCKKSIMPGIGAEAVIPDAITPTNVDNGA
ncbi:hypothetical protein [Burkholderia sp. Bp8984]|uniref:hypothetical protein n=1 Tax=Burkholderia sp. Bp8984 TaxID=2184549 RepID=UPI000F59FC28|nr:hypothetical protein [Burkholderia sp. Bp8984]RQS63828.1 hypothetical protein DID98_02805 [Burkholderia sp. Bp8984]